MECQKAVKYILQFLLVIALIIVTYNHRWARVLGQGGGTVSLSRIWFIDEMNPGNGYYSSPDPYLGNQMAPKIEKSTEPF